MDIDLFDKNLGWRVEIRQSHLKNDKLNVQNEVDIQRQHGKLIWLKMMGRQSFLIFENYKCLNGVQSLQQEGKKWQVEQTEIQTQFLQFSRKQWFSMFRNDFHCKTNKFPKPCWSHSDLKPKINDKNLQKRNNQRPYSMSSSLLSS